MKIVLTDTVYLPFMRSKQKPEKKKWLLLRSEILSEISIYTRIRRYWISNQRFSKICINNKTTSRVNWNCLRNDNNNKMCRGPPQPLLLLRLSRRPLVAYCFFSPRAFLFRYEKNSRNCMESMLSARSRAYLMVRKLNLLRTFTPCRTVRPAGRWEHFSAHF